MNQEILDLIVKLFLAVLSVIVTTYVIPWINSKKESTKFNDLLVLIEKCVQAAEKIYTPEEWSAKKEYVLELASAYAMDKGIDIDPAELNALIEGFVKVVKG